MKKYISRFCLFIFVGLLICAVFYFWPSIKSYFSPFDRNQLNQPTEQLNSKWNKIESLLDKKDLEAVKFTNSILTNLVVKEDNLTALLEQKNAVQISVTSVVITIVLAVLGFLANSKHVLLFSKKQRNVLFLFTVLIVVCFALSMFFSFRAYVVRSDFTFYNIDEFFDLMSVDAKSNLKSFLISDILANYQIYMSNGEVNEIKACNLKLASVFSCVGLLGFMLTALSVLFMFKKYHNKSKEVISP